MNKEEKRKLIREIYFKVVEEIDIITNSNAKDIRIEQVVFNSEYKITNLVISFLLKNYNRLDEVIGGWSGITPEYERIYKEIKINNNNEIVEILVTQLV